MPFAMRNQSLGKKAENNRNPLIWRAFVVFAAALLARILFFAWRGASTSPDSGEYLTLAHNLVAHHSFSLHAAAPFIPSVRRSPAYPAMLAALEWLHLLSPAYIVIVQAVCDSLVAVMVLLLTRLITFVRWATIAAIFYALHPGAIYTATTILSEPLFTFLLTTALALLIFGVKSDRRALTAASGLFMGAAILCRPISLPLALSLVAILLIKRRFSGQWRHALLFAIGSAIVVAPWSLRTSYVSGEPVFVQAHGAVNYWAPTVLFIDQRNESQIWTYEAELLKARLPDGPYSPQKALDSDRILKQEAIANIRANPIGYIKSRIRSYPYLFLNSFDNFSGLNNSFGALMAQRALGQLAVKASLLLIFSALPLLFAFIGFLLGRRDLIVTLLSATWLYTLVVHLPLWIEYRFWVPVVPFVAATAALGVSRIITRVPLSEQPAKTVV